MTSKNEVVANALAARNESPCVARNDLARLIRDMGVQAKKGNKSGALNIVKDFKRAIVAEKGQAAYDEIVRMIQDGKEIPRSLYGKFEAKASRIPKDVGIVRYDPKTDAFVDVKTGKPRSNSAAAGEAVATNARTDWEQEVYNLTERVKKLVAKAKAEGATGPDSVGEIFENCLKVLRGY